MSNLISIIVALKNGAKSIEKTILSILNQTHRNYEIIIIDGKSSDNSLDIVNRYSSRISVIISEEDSGIYDALNKGIYFARGEWVYFLGSDDILYGNDVLENIFNTKIAIDCDVIYGNVLLLQSNKIFDGPFSHNKHALKSICQQAIFYRKTLFDEFGKFNVKYRTNADYVFNMSVFSKKPENCKYVNIVIAKYNEIGASYQREDVNYQNECFAIRYDNFRLLCSGVVLSRIFYSSYYRYVRNHALRESARYLSLILKDVGLYNLCKNIVVLFLNRLSGK